MPISNDQAITVDRTRYSKRKAALNVGPQRMQRDTLAGDQNQYAAKCERAT
jgi:hypothetical protein